MNLEQCFDLQCNLAKNAWIDCYQLQRWKFRFWVAYVIRAEWRVHKVSSNLSWYDQCRYALRLPRGIDLCLCRVNRQWHWENGVLVGQRQSTTSRLFFWANVGMHFIHLHYVYCLAPRYLKACFFAICLYPIIDQLTEILSLPNTSPRLAVSRFCHSLCVPLYTYSHNPYISNAVSP